MKLLHITATHLNPTGGVPVVLKCLVEEQNKIVGFEARVLSLKASANNMDSSFFDTLQNTNLKDYLTLYKPDIVILHSFFYLEYAYVSYLLKKLSIPYYIEPHGSFVKEAMRKSRLKKIIADNTVFKPLINDAYGYIFLNETEKNDSIYRKESDLVIPNGITKLDIGHRNLSKKELKFYFIGRYDVHGKGLDYLFDALEILNKDSISVPFVFWGSGSAKDVEYINARSKNLHNLKIAINGPIFADEKDDVLETIGPMMLTSRYEGFPMTILEAFNYGNPCLVTKGTNMGEEISENSLGWFVETNPEDIANGIKKALNEYTENRSDYINRCKKYVTEHYSWCDIARKSFLCLQGALG